MTKWPKITLKSPWGRLLLVPPEAQDDAQVAALRSDPEALRYLPFMPKTISVEEWRVKREGQAENDEIWNFNVHLIDTSQSTSDSSLVGQCGILRMDLPNRHAELGILISPRLHRTGIATEALYDTLSHAFEYPELRLHRVQFVTSSNNVQMRGWLESFGIELEYLKREDWIDGQGGWLDSVGYYSVLEGEWPALKKKLEEKLVGRLGSIDGV